MREGCWIKPSHLWNRICVCHNYHDTQKNLLHTIRANTSLHNTLFTGWFQRYMQSSPHMNLVTQKNSNMTRLTSCYGASFPQSEATLSGSGKTVPITMVSIMVPLLLNVNKTGCCPVTLIDLLNRFELGWDLMFHTFDHYHPQQSPRVLYLHHVWAPAVFTYQWCLSRIHMYSPVTCPRKTLSIWHLT